ncbi:hypothetical protein AAW50_00745 [Mycoplasmopsis canis]|uniref:hypothetical protein n=1 Tax=Mycoplasmopsis canis TaxID=29555 RepID=UPI000624E922|nr:hypothetical protein [Mycoplasmopsis canis]AKF40971.1 hypothetical protein AAW50_00745 [Mycoplasmopsis canis]
MSENTKKDVEKEILKVTFKAKRKSNLRWIFLGLAILFMIIAMITFVIGVSGINSNLISIGGLSMGLFAFLLMAFIFISKWPNIDYTKQECTITNKRVYGHKFNIKNLPNGKRLINQQKDFFSIRVSYIDHVIIDANTGDLVINYDVDKSLRLLEVNDKFTVLKTIEDLALEKETF